MRSYQRWVMESSVGLVSACSGPVLVMYRMALQVAVTAVLVGCAPDVTVEHRIGGHVRGLWDGADGVALRLQARDADALLTVTANGAFHFAELFDPGTSYTVTVATNPVEHTCVVDAGGNGMVADADVTSVSIVCTGPAISIALSGPWGVDVRSDPGDADIRGIDHRAGRGAHGQR